MKLIGLTGGIATGKSTASKILREMGVRVIDADQVSHQVLADGSPYLAGIEERFGSSMLISPKKLNREALGKVIFSSPAKKKLLEDFLHPVIREEMEKEIQQGELEGLPFMVLDIPLLIESSYWPERVDEIWLIDANEELQKSRLHSRNGYTEDEALARIRAQLPMVEKRKVADQVFLNEGKIADLERQLGQAIKKNEKI